MHSGILGKVHKIVYIVRNVGIAIDLHILYSIFIERMNIPTKSACKLMHKGRPSGAQAQCKAGAAGTRTPSTCLSL